MNINQIKYRVSNETQRAIALYAARLLRPIKITQKGK